MYMTPTQIAEELNISPRTVQNWCKTGVITAYKFGNSFRITDEDFQLFLNNSKVEKEIKNND